MVLLPFSQNKLIITIFSLLGIYNIFVGTFGTGVPFIISFREKKTMNLYVLLAYS